MGADCTYDQLPPVVKAFFDEIESPVTLAMAMAVVMAMAISVAMAITMAMTSTRTQLTCEGVAEGPAHAG